MALFFGTGVATATATSYALTASADDYFASRTNADQWSNISSQTSNTTTIRQQKEGLLIQATREIDHTYRFFGSKYNQGIEGQTTFQNLEFPRSHHVKSDSTAFIKDEIKFATYEQALWILERRSSRKTEDGALVERKLMSREAFLYLKPFIDLSVKRSGNYPWQGSKY